MTGQCRICGELVLPAGQVIEAPDRDQAEFAVLAVAGFFHVLQRHPEVAKGCCDTLMGMVGQYVAALCLDTTAPDGEALLSRMQEDLVKLIQGARYSSTQKNVLLGLSASADDSENSQCFA